MFEGFHTKALITGSYNNPSMLISLAEVQAQQPFSSLCKLCEQLKNREERKATLEFLGSLPCGLLWYFHIYPTFSDAASGHVPFDWSTPLGILCGLLWRVQDVGRGLDSQRSKLHTIFIKFHTNHKTQDICSFSVL